MMASCAEKTPDIALSSLHAADSIADSTVKPAFTTPIDIFLKPDVKRLIR
ncbi:hypothetical protein J7438_02720 [Thalassotalea sp. G20_0]|nr:hypothetical protein [Thalassotalea sp. G20_0]MBO9493005.1 hypothetical protein [Thalassotalea sp. G20_0]